VMETLTPIHGNLTDLDAFGADLGV